MNQQNFKLSDFGIETKPSHAVEQGKGSSRYAQILAVQSQQMQTRILGSPSNVSNPLQVACNRCQLTSRCTTLTCNANLRRSPNQVQNVAGDQLQAPGPNNNSAGSGTMLQPTVSTIPSPGYWNRYGGQESGVNAITNVRVILARESDFLGRSHSTTSFAFRLPRRRKVSREPRREICRLVAVRIGPV